MNTKNTEFTCNGCGHELPNSFSLRTKDYCYMCDPNISLSELLTKEKLNNGAWGMFIHDNSTPSKKALPYEQ